MGAALKRRSETVMVFLDCAPSSALPCRRQNFGFRHRIARAVAGLLIAIFGTLAYPSPPSVSAMQDALLPTASTTPESFSDSSMLAETQQLVLNAIKKRELNSPSDLVVAASTLHDAGLDQDVRFLLGKLDQLQLNDDQWLAVVDETGSSFFLKIFSDLGSQPEGRTVAIKVLAAAKRASSEPARVQRLIKTLSSSDHSARNNALGQLETCGELAMAELINVFADPSRESEFKTVRGTIDLFASSLPDPLLGAARSKNITIKTEAIRALAKVNSPRSSDVLMWCHLAPQHPSALKSFAHDVLVRRGMEFSSSEIEQRFFRRAMQYVQGNVETPVEFFGNVDLWNWDPKSNRMVSHSVPTELATRLDATRYAASLYEINPASVRNRAIFLLTQLESFQRVAGPGVPIDAELVLDRLKSNATEINTILAQAVRMKLYPAATACCEILKLKGDESLLNHADGKPTALIMAITSGDRYLQFAAFDAIQKINPQHAYVGSSYVLNLGVYLAQSNGHPVALFGHPDGTVALSYAASVGTEDLTGIAATSGRQLFELATSNPDVEMIMISDRLSRPGYSNLIRQLRNDWRTQRIPIALLFEDVDRGHLASLNLDQDDLFVAIPYSSSPSLIDTHVERLKQRIAPFRVTGIDRQKQSEVALQWLATISQSREEYRFYDLAQHQKALSGLIFRPGFEAPMSSILSSIGTPESQRQLIDFASRGSVSVESRKQAAAAFAKAVERGGTLLTTKEIQAQYDRYNASESEPKATQQILGSILDVIEANRNR